MRVSSISGSGVSSPCEARNSPAMLRALTAFGLNLAAEQQYGVNFFDLSRKRDTMRLTGVLVPGKGNNAADRSCSAISKQLCADTTCLICNLVQTLRATCVRGGLRVSG